MMRNQRRPAFTLLESLVCLSLLLILLGLLVPAVARARAAARGQGSVNNLRMIAISVHNYADAKNGTLPPGFDDNHFSAASRLLPFLEQEKLYKKIDFSKSIDDKANAEVRQTVVRLFMDPDDKAPPPTKDPTKGYGPTNYLFNGLAFYHNSKLRFPASFTDGTSNTVLLAETLRGDRNAKGTDVRRQYVVLSVREAAKYQANRAAMGVDEFKDGKHTAADRCASWMDGRFLQGAFLPGRVPNDPRPDVMVGTAERMDGLSAPRSTEDKIRVAMADGSVRLVSSKITATTWEAALTPAGGEILGADW
jgi:type II secretory pathway pseudopilin PulG